jgi:hypothetical protein
LLLKIFLKRPLKIVIAIITAITIFARDKAAENKPDKGWREFDRRR